MLSKNEDMKDSVTIIFKPILNNIDNTRILGKSFVEKNKDKCYIEYQGTIHDLKEYFEEIDNNYNHQDTKAFFPTGANKIKDMSYLFADCNKLSLLLITSEYNFWKKNMDKIDETFFEKNISSFDFSSESNPCFSNKDDTNSFNKENSSFNTVLSNIEKTKDSNDDMRDRHLIASTLINSNVTSMSHLFYNCNSIISLPDITQFDTSNIINMSYAFFGCNSLKSLPHISKWNTSNAKNMSNIFGECDSIISLPDISKWNTSNVQHMSQIIVNVDHY